MTGRRVAAGAVLVGLLVGAGVAGGRAASISLTSQTLTPYRTCTLTATPATATVEIDTTARQGSATSNFGTLTTLTVSSASAANQRTYLRFDMTRCIPAIPAAAIVRLATLRVFATALPAVCRTVDLFPSTATWTEAGLTWNNQPFGTTINNPASASRSGTFDIGTPVGCQNRTNNAYVVGGTVTTDVAAFVAGSTTNFGWMLRDDVEGSATARTTTFSAKNLGTAAQGPQARDHLRDGAMRRGHIGLALLMALLAAWFVFLRPVSLGGSALYIVIRGDSMEPNYLSGDLLVVQAAPSYGTGDVIAYRVPSGEVGEGIVVVHRIVGGSTGGGFEMRGDNNPSTDPWTPHGTDVVGKAWVLVPGLGRVLVAIRQPLVLAALAASLVVGFVIWRGPTGRLPAPAPVAAPRAAPSARDRLRREGRLR